MCEICEICELGAVPQQVPWGLKARQEASGHLRALEIHKFHKFHKFPKSKTKVLAERPFKNSQM